MRKTLRNLALGAMAVIGLSASAFTTPDNLYIVGTVTTNDGTPNWNPAEAVALTKSGDTFTIEPVTFNGSPAYFHFLNTKGTSSSDWPSTRYSAGSGTQAVTLDVPKTVYMGTSDNSFSFAGTAGQVYKITVDCSAGTLLIEESEGEVEVSYPTSLYVIGQVENSDWSPSVGIELSTTDDGHTWTGTGNITGEGQFSFATQIGSDWDSGPNAGTRYAPNADITVTAGNEFAIYVGSSSSACWIITPGEYEFSVDIENMKATLTLIAAVYPESLYVIGNTEGTNGNDWDPTTGIELTSTDDGKTWTGTGTLISSPSYFAFAEFLSSNGNWTETNAGMRFSPGTNTNITAGVEQTLKSGADGAWIIDAGTYEFSVDYENYTFTLTEVKTPTPTTLYVIGSNEGTWDFSKALAELTSEGDDTFTGELVLEGYETYYFRLAENIGSSSDDEAGVGTQFGSADADGTAIQLGQEMEFEVGTYTWTIPGGNYTITVNFEDMTISIEGTANQKPEYQASGEMYLLGIGGFQPNEGLQMEGSDGVFTVTAQFTEETNYFNFSDALAETNSWDELNENANRFGASSPDMTPEFGDDNDVVLYQAGVNAGAVTAWKVDAGKYEINLNLNTMNMTIEQIEEAVAPTVTATPAAGTYESAQEVTLTANPELSLIYYTTDGTEPTQDAQYLYSAPITVDQSMTIKVLAVSPYNLTTTTEFAYTISTTAIGSIVGDNAEGTVEVYDLSGRQIKADTLKPGMYIIRRGGEAQKVLVK